MSQSQPDLPTVFQDSQAMQGDITLNKPPNTLYIYMSELKIDAGDGGDGSMIKSTDYTFREIGFGSQNPYASSNPSRTSAPGVPEPFLTSVGIKYTYIDIHAGKTDKNLCAGVMAYQVKVSAIKPDNLSSIRGTHKQEEED